MSHQYCEPVKLAVREGWTFFLKPSIFSVIPCLEGEWKLLKQPIWRNMGAGRVCQMFLVQSISLWLMVGDNVEMSNMDIEPLRYWVIKYSNTKCVHTFIHFVYDPFIFTILLQSRLSLSKEMKCYIYFPTFYSGEEEWNIEST